MDLATSHDGDSASAAQGWNPDRVATDLTQLADVATALNVNSTDRDSGGPLGSSPTLTMYPVSGTQGLVMNENRREFTANREDVKNQKFTLVPTYDSPFPVCRAVPDKPLSIEVQGYESFVEADWAALNIDHDETVAMIDDSMLDDVSAVVDVDRYKINDVVDVRTHNVDCAPTPPFDGDVTPRPTPRLSPRPPSKPVFPSLSDRHSPFRPVSRTPTCNGGYDAEVHNFTAVHNFTRPSSFRSVVPSRQRSHVSTRVPSCASAAAVDLNWIGEFVMGVAQVATQREVRDAEERRQLLETAQAREEKLVIDAQARERQLIAQAQALEDKAQAREDRLMQQAQAREKELLQEARLRERTAYDLAAAQEQYNLDTMRNMMRERDNIANERERIAFEREQHQIELAFKHAEKEKEMLIERENIALDRENQIRLDLKQLAAVENRNAMLEYQLREMRFKQKNLRVATAAPPPSLVSVEDQIDKLIDTSSSSEIDDKGMQALVHGVIPKPSSPVIDHSGHFMSNAQTDVDNAAFAAWPITAPQQMSLGNASGTAQTLSQSAEVKPTQAEPIFVAPTLPPPKSMNLVPVSAITNATPELMQKLSIINTPSGPAVQTVSLTNAAAQASLATAAQSTQVDGPHPHPFHPTRQIKLIHPGHLNHPNRPHHPARPHKQME